MNESFQVGSGWSEDEDSDYDNFMSQMDDAGYSPAKGPHPLSAFSYTFQDVEVLFPYEAYPSQKDLMEKIIQGVRSGENCLLESPTGTGKTAALLCSLLAWRQWGHRNSQLALEDADKIAKEIGKCTCGLYPKEYPCDQYQIRVSLGPSAGTMMSELVESATEQPSCADLFASPSSASCKSPRKTRKTCTELVVKLISDLCKFCIKKNQILLPPPKIYYATRTHSQIKQIIHQLKALPQPYCQAKMTILAGRSSTCIYDKAKVCDLEVDSDSDQDQDPDIKPDQDRVDDNCGKLRRNFNRRKRLLQLQGERSLILQESEELKHLSQEGKTCPFYKDYLPMREEFMKLNRKGCWDIEELVEHGKSCEVCPFYGARALHSIAEIVFCPYNYILDPGIRGNAGVKLKNSVIVLDEAHNIEGNCCDVASHSFNLDNIDYARLRYFDERLQLRSKLTIDLPIIKAIEHFSLALQKLSTWMRTHGPKVTVRRDRNEIPSSISYSGKELLEALEKAGFGPKTMDAHWTNLKVFEVPEQENQDQDQENESQFEAESQSQETTNQPDQSESPNQTRGRKLIKKKFQMPQKGLRFIKKLLSTLDLVFTCDEDEECSPHYALVLSNSGKETKQSKRTVEVEPNPNLPVPAPTPTTETKTVAYNFTLDIMCLSPTVAFRPIRDQAHSIIVASGTLTPLNSFAGELETPFKNQLIASHVIKEHQIWAGVVGTSPCGQDLLLNSKNQGIRAVQLGIGSAILQICKVSPFGVLVFLPSYGFLTSLLSSLSLPQPQPQTPNQSQNQTQSQTIQIPILKQIEEFKKIFTEKSGKDKELFNKEIQEFKEQAVVGNGCVLFAVFRGKVSEGIDFKDNEARAVISVGIPYAYFGSNEVKKKREYNDRRRMEAKLKLATTKAQGYDYELLSGAELANTKAQGYELLSGAEWYGVQAFRAMNQGLGRVIRHKDDWGAIILLDSRMHWSSSSSNISKWVQDNLKTFHRFQEAEQSLKIFFERMSKEPEPEPKKANLDTTMESLNPKDFGMDMDMDVDENFSQSQMSQNRRRLSQAEICDMTTILCPSTSTPIPSSSSRSRPPMSASASSSALAVVDDLDSSAYSVDFDLPDDEEDEDGFEFDVDTPATPPIQNSRNSNGNGTYSNGKRVSRILFEDLPTQRIIQPQLQPDNNDNDSSYENISYHSNSSGPSSVL